MKALLPLAGMCMASCVAAPSPKPTFALGEAPTSASFAPAAGPEVRLPELSAENLAAASVQQPTPARGRPRWRVNQPLMQGFFGVADYANIEREDGSFDVEVDDTEVPLLGGGAQVKLGGEKVDWGLEGMFSMGWSSNASAVAIGGGGAAVAIDVDMFIFDLYGGPFISTYLGDRLRLWGSVGPLVEFANFDDNGYDTDGTGFGYGTYARAGIELQLGPGMLLGFGMRWSDSTVDLGGSGDLKVDGLQYLITVSRGI